MPAQISVPIIDLLTHPPIGLLQRDLITGTFTGSVDFTRATGAPPPFNHVNAYGMTWDFLTVPAGFGYTIGTPRIYDERMVQASAMYEDIAGHELIGEYHDFHSEGLFWLWDSPGPSRVHLEIAPGVVLVVYWILV